MKRYLLGILLVGTLILIGAGTGLADGAVGAGSPVSDTFTIFSPTGSVYDSISITEDEELADPNNIVYFTDSNLVNPDMWGFATTLLEPNGQYSDIFGIAYVNGGYYLAFSSDTETSTPYGWQGYYFLPEGNGVLDATKYLNTNLVGSGYTAEFRSDVPEPTTLLLLGFGLTALAGVRRKFKK